MSLTSKTCVPCRGGIPPLDDAAARAFLDQTPGWELIDGTTRIRRTFTLGDFAEAMALVQKVGDLAEDEGHHPDITFGWGYCTVPLLHPQDQGPARERFHHGGQGQRAGRRIVS